MDNVKYKKIREKRKLLEELKIDLLEIEAYRDLQDESFIFGNTLVKNESKFSEDAYYEIIEDAIEEKIYELEFEKG